jgi:hypothetical protein
MTACLYCGLEWDTTPTPTAARPSRRHRQEAAHLLVLVVLVAAVLRVVGLPRRMLLPLRRIVG